MERRILVNKKRKRINEPSFLSTHTLLTIWRKYIVFFLNLYTMKRNGSFLGMRNRVVGSHQMNDHSSRSHTMLTVHITSEQQAEGGVFISKQGKIHFVDLAGSEMTKKTMSEGTTLEEANNINKSLMVLGAVNKVYFFILF